MNRRPPVFLENLIARLIPASCREYIVGDLRERYQSNGQYCIRALQTVPVVVAGRMKRTFDPAFLVVQLCGLFMAFEAAWRLSDMPLLTNVSQLMRLAIPALAGLIALLVRDAYVDHENRNPLQAILDVSIGAVLPIVVELLFIGAASTLALPALVIGKAALITIFILSVVRMSLWAVMRPRKEAASITEAALQFQKRIRHRNIREYAASVVVVLIFGVSAVRAPNPATRGVLFLVVVVTVYMIYRLHKKGWADAVPSNSSPAECRTVYRRELVRQRDLLQGVWKGLTMLFVPLVILLFATPAPVAARLELPVMALCTYILAFALIGKLNGVAARKLTQRIHTLDTLEPPL